MAVELFAGISVSDYEQALSWYERLLGSPPSFVPHATEAVWELAEHRYLYIEQQAEDAGHAQHTIFVDDLDTAVGQITGRGLDPFERESYDNGARKVTYRDPDGNEIGLGGGPATDTGEPVRVIRSADLTEADPTPGMLRSKAFERPVLWAGQVVTSPGAVSGWHHHDRNDTSLYVVSGVLRLEFDGGDGYLDATAGDFVHVPPFTVHRESNPSSQPSLAVIARAGGGVPTVNVDAPAGRI